MRSRQDDSSMISADLGRSRPISADLARLRCDVCEYEVVLTPELGRHSVGSARTVDAVGAVDIRRDASQRIGEHVAVIILCRPAEERALVDERAVPAPNLHNEPTSASDDRSRSSAPSRRISRRISRRSSRLCVTGKPLVFHAEASACLLTMSSYIR